MPVISYGLLSVGKNHILEWFWKLIIKTLNSVSNR